MKWNMLSPFNRGLLFIFIINVILFSFINAKVLSLLPDSSSAETYNFDKKTTLDYTVKFLIFSHAGDDSWWPMTEALEHLHENPEQPVYSEIFFNKKIKFQYPPSSLLLLELLSPYIDKTQPIASNQYIFNILSWFFVIIIGLITAKILHNNLRLPLNRNYYFDSKGNLLVLYGLVLLFTVTFFPLILSWRLGQYQTTITLFAATALLCWQYQHKKLSGFFMGVVCTIKPHFAIIFIWGAIRKQWGMFLTGTITALILVGISIYLYGFHHYLDYVSVLSHMSRSGESFHSNQSINGLMNRLLFNGNNLHWEYKAFAPFHPIVYGTTFISSILLLGGSMIWKMNKARNVGVYEFAIVILSVTIASPLAWEHHHAILLPIFAILIPTALSLSILGRWTWVYLFILYFLASHHLEITNYLSDTGFNFLQSYLFFSSIISLFLLYRISYKNT